MRLLTLMVGRFAQSILDGSEVDAVHSLTDLCEALESGFRGLGPVLRAVGTQVAQLNDALHTITSSLDRAARRLGQWVDLRGGGAGSSGSPVVDEVAQLTSRGCTCPTTRTSPLSAWPPCALPWQSSSEVGGIGAAVDLRPPASGETR